MTETPGSVSVTTTETSPTLRTLEVEVDAKRVRKAFERAYKDLGRTAKVKGFRPGKVPRSVLEKLYGPSMGEELEQQLVRETLPEAVERSGAIPVAEPTVETATPSEDEPFRYTARIEVKPAIELPELLGLPTRRPLVEVPDADVERELETLRERRGELVDEEDGTAAGSGATLEVDYEGRIEGEPFDGGAAQGASIELGAGRLIPGFEEQLEGARAGDEREVRVSFPEDYGATELAGKDAVFAVKVHAVRRRELPLLDDAFAKSLGEEFEDLAALRQRIHDDLLESREQDARREARRTLMDALIERCEFDVPPGLVDRRLQQRLAMAHQQLHHSMPHEELHQQLDRWREEWRPDAERDVRETLLLEAVAEHQGLEVSDEEVEEKIEQIARDQGLAPARLRQRYEEQGALPGLRGQLAEEKALEFLLAMAKVEETTGT